LKKLGTKHENLDHKVYKRLKSMILERKLEPGAKIYQDKLAHELGISRTPLVNALKKLEQGKLIKAIPRRGFYVQRFSLKEMIHIFELREVLEGLAARRACLHISDSQIEKLKHFFKGLKISNDPKDLRNYAEEDRKFHHFLMEMGGSDFLSSILGTYNILTFSYQGGFQAGLVRPPKETIREHLAVIEAISNRDPDQAEELARRHLKISTEKLRKDLEEEKGEDHED
jgi:DNA-binding GntR family transcriptional regulator